MVNESSKTLDEHVHEAIGAASMCWESLGGTGVFDYNRALQIGSDLMARIEEWGLQPRLGYATTTELLDEIRTRIEIDKYNGGGGLDYRAVDHS